MKRIVVEVPTSDARRERVERGVFAQLQAAKIADRAEAALPPKPRRTGRYILLGGALAAAAAIAIIVLPRGGGTHATAPTAVATPSRIVTPPGATSRFTVGDAVIDAGSDTSVEVQTGTAGEVTLVLARGSVDCDVEPRHGRPPFRVVAGDVKVEVVGTRFTVTRTPAPRVEVTRGKVRVSTPGGEWLVEAGATWPQAAQPQTGTTTEATESTESTESTERAERAESETEPKPALSPTRNVKPVTPEDAQLAADKLARTNPAKAARIYRALANGTSATAPVALYSLIELHADTSHAAALAEIGEYQRRFEHGTNAEEVAWLKAQITRSKEAAADYLRAFPAGTFTRDAKRILAAP